MNLHTHYAPYTYILINTKRIHHKHNYICACMNDGEGNGNPLQYSCLENPVDIRAWWALVHRVAQSWTWLKRLSMHACIGEGNGNPLQYSCLKNPGDRGAWWAAIYEVTQSQTRLKQLSSSSSSSSRDQPKPEKSQVAYPCLISCLKNWKYSWVESMFWTLLSDWSLS